MLCIKIKQHKSQDDARVVGLSDLNFEPWELGMSLPRNTQISKELVLCLRK